jgi:hypothetical protein
MSNLVRWKADPKKISVSIMKFPESMWRAKVTCLSSGDFTYFIGYDDPENVILKALHLAEEEGYEGLDLGMQWAYEHPWKKA